MDLQMVSPRAKRANRRAKHVGRVWRCYPVGIPWSCKTNTP